MIEKPAKGQKGFLLFNPNTNTHFFRVYHETSYTDYEINVYDIEIEIVDGYTFFYESETENIIDYKKKYPPV